MTKPLRKIHLSPKDKKVLKKFLKEAQVVIKGGSWVSSAGLKLSSWLVTERLISKPDCLKLITEQLKDLIEQENIQMIAACSTSGIPWATFISYRYNLPLIVLRKRKERHGEKSLIIGDSRKLANKNTLLVDDNVLTGNSMRLFFNSLKKEKVLIKNIFVFDIWKNADTEMTISNWLRKKKVTLWYIMSFNIKD